MIRFTHNTKLWLSLALLSVTGLAMTGCQLTDVPEIPDQSAPPMPLDAQPSPLRLGNISVKIPRGAEMGSISPRFITCESPYGYIEHSDIRELLTLEEVKDVFDDTLEGLGYDITGRSTLLYEEDIEDDEARTIYTVTARITDIKIDLCRKERVTNLAGLVWGASKSMMNGEAAMTVEWSVSDRLQRKQVWRGVTQGYSHRKTSTPDGDALLLQDAFAAATHNLGATAQFHALIVDGKTPDPSQSGLKKTAYRGKFDGNEAVTRPTLPLSKNNVQPRLETIRNNAVLVRVGTGHGSGFFITDQGHILTNAHVTGDANRIAIVTANKKYTLYGEVLRRDKHRDVALIRLENPPPKDAYTLLPLRLDIPKVGEDVYAIGAPFSERVLQDTVTKGIISAYRQHDPIDKQSYLQTDVYVTGGNSGGPILDANGNIVAILVAGYTKEGQELSGLNLAIPIQSALKALNIK